VAAGGAGLHWHRGEQPQPQLPMVRFDQGTVWHLILSFFYIMQHSFAYLLDFS
jgi:hypothetical protein